MEATIQANAGNGGSGAARGAGGNAKAKGVVSGADVSALASANSGAGATDGIATAKLHVSGSSGGFGASADVPTGQGGLVTTVSAGAAGEVSGTSVGKARADLGQAAFGQAVSATAIGSITGAPLAADTGAVIDAAQNSAIKRAFGSSPAFFALAQMGGAYSSGGSGSETNESVVNLTVDLSQLASAGDLLIGLHDPTTVGTGFSSLTFTLAADDKTLIDKAFTSLTAAQTYFSDDPIDLGSLASGPLSSPTLTIEAGLTLTETTAGAGFYAQLIIGDPPAAAGFAGAMARLGATGAAPVWASDRRGAAPPQLAVALA